MEYQKIANLLDSAPNQPSKFRTRNWVEINAYILVKGTITITGAGNDDATKQAGEIDKGVTFKNCALFTKCISGINNADMENAQGDDYTTGCLLDYPYFKDHYKMIPIDLSKQQALGADPSAIQHINFIANLHRNGNTTMFFTIEEAKETALNFLKREVKIL